MSSLTIADVERIAALAHLELTDEEKQLFTRQLADILDYAEQLQAVDTTGVPATAHVTDFGARVAALDLASIEPEAWEEVVDPGGGEQDVFDTCARELDVLVDELIDALGAPRRSS